MKTFLIINLIFAAVTVAIIWFAAADVQARLGDALVGLLLATEGV